MTATIALGVVAFWLASWQSATATAPTAGEMSEARRWAAAKFEGVENAKGSDGELHVLANNDPVIPNGRGGKPLLIVDKPYTRGLYCHAVSKVIVRLPGVGKTFSAIVGVDSNEQTRPGRGSVVFSVTVGDKNAFRSPLMREGMPGVPVEVDLAGAREFVLDVGDGGDGISCDQSDWADARVAMADGSTVWLGDLPISGIFGAYGRAYGTGPFFSFTYDGKPSSELLRLDVEAREPIARRLAYAAHAQLHGSQDRAGGALRRHRVSRLSHRGVDALFQEFKRQGYADPLRHSGPRHAVGAGPRAERAADGVLPAPPRRQPLRRTTISRWKRSWRPA